MSKRTDMIHRIVAAMPDDAEVQVWGTRELERAGKSAARTRERASIAEDTLMCEVHPVTAKQLAEKINKRYPKQDTWNPRTASYYLSALVKQGKAVYTVSTEKKCREYEYVLR